MPEESEPARKWTDMIPAKWVGTVLLTVIGGLGTVGAIKGVQNEQRIEEAEDAADSYVPRFVFRAVVDSLNRRDAKQDAKIRRLELALKRARVVKRPLTDAEALEVEAILIGPPPPPKRTGTLLRSLLGLIPGVR